MKPASFLLGIYGVSLLCIGCGTGFAEPNDRAGATDSASLTADGCPAVPVTGLAINQGVEIPIADESGPILATVAPLLDGRSGALKITFSPASDWPGGAVDFRIVTATETGQEVDVWSASAFVAAGPDTTSVYETYTPYSGTRVRVELVRPEGCPATVPSNDEGVTDLAGTPIPLEVELPDGKTEIHFVVLSDPRPWESGYADTMFAYERQLARMYPTFDAFAWPYMFPSPVEEFRSSYAPGGFEREGPAELFERALLRLEELQQELQAESPFAVYVIGTLPGFPTELEPRVRLPEALVGRRAAIVPLGTGYEVFGRVEPRQIALAVNATIASALGEEHHVLRCRSEHDQPFPAVGVEGYDIDRQMPVPATSPKVLDPRLPNLTECEGGWIDPATYREVFERVYGP